MLFELISFSIIKTYTRYTCVNVFDLLHVHYNVQHLWLSDLHVNPEKCNNIYNSLIYLAGYLEVKLD